VDGLVGAAFSGAAFIGAAVLGTAVLAVTFLATAVDTAVSGAAVFGAAVLKPAADCLIDGAVVFAEKVWTEVLVGTAVLDGVEAAVALLIFVCVFVAIEAIEDVGTDVLEVAAYCLIDGAGVVFAGTEVDFGTAVFKHVVAGVTVLGAAVFKHVLSGVTVLGAAVIAAVVVGAVVVGAAILAAAVIDAAVLAAAGVGAAVIGPAGIGVDIGLALTFMLWMLLFLDELIPRIVLDVADTASDALSLSLRKSVLGPFPVP